MESGKIILHACSMSDWLKAKEIGEYKPKSLTSQGFIHCSQIETITRVANSNWKGREDLVLLIIDSDKVKEKIKYEPDLKSGVLYPHIYGPLNLDAVVEIKNFPPRSDGSFEEPIID